jgi:hypothetical protein
MNFGISPSRKRVRHNERKQQQQTRYLDLMERFPGKPKKHKEDKEKLAEV